ncbi:MAG: DNA polymerase III subunit delta' [Pyrinomonadaceae bacterium]|nr:DNA polymerase III subunit delta' [Pyrinomonadaceae bacterium]
MFDQLIGNNHITTVLRRWLAKKRVPRSLLFAGADGVGKKQFALELAKSFVCRNPNSAEACDVCVNCRRADKFAYPKSDDRDAYKKVIFTEHPDIGFVIPYNKNILVDAIRELEREANFRPYEAQARFFIIDDADKMNDSASNALLKTLEEPPATSHIFLISARPDALLPTIRSRCQTVRFAPIQTTEIENYLLQTKDFTPDDAKLLAKLADGKLGNVQKTDVGKFRVNRASMLKVLESILIKKDRAELLRIGEEMNDAKNKDDFEMRLNILQTLIHDVWVMRNAADAKILVNIDLMNDLKKFAERGESKKLSAWLSEIELLREQLAVNLNRKIATDALFMQMANG